MKTYRITLSREVTQWSEEIEVQASDLRDACHAALAAEDTVQFLRSDEDYSDARVAFITVTNVEGEEHDADVPAPFSTRSLSNWSDEALREELAVRAAANTQTKE